MGDYKYIDHTADKGFQIEATSLEELFEISLQALAELLRHDLVGNKKNLHIEHYLELEAGDATALLVDFLSEVLTLSHIHKTVFLKCTLHELTQNQLKADIFGKKVDRFDEEIKAVTYHEANIQPIADGKMGTTLIFDI